MINPYQPPELLGSEPNEGTPGQTKPGGIGRLSFFGFLILISLAQVALLRIFSSRNSELLLVPGFWIVAAIFPAYFRFRNIGMKPIISLFMIVPIVNIFIVVTLLIYQESFEASGRKLDLSGKISLLMIVCCGAGFAILLARGY